MSGFDLVDVTFRPLVFSAIYWSLTATDISFPDFFLVSWLVSWWCSGLAYLLSAVIPPSSVVLAGGPSFLPPSPLPPTCFLVPCPPFRSASPSLSPPRPLRCCPQEMIWRFLWGAEGGGCCLQAPVSPLSLPGSSTATTPLWRAWGLTARCTCLPTCLMRGEPAAPLAPARPSPTPFPPFPALLSALLRPPLSEKPCSIQVGNRVPHGEVL